MKKVNSLIVVNGEFLPGNDSLLVNVGRLRGESCGHTQLGSSSGKAQEAQGYQHLNNITNSSKQYKFAWDKH